MLRVQWEDLGFVEQPDLWDPLDPPAPSASVASEDQRERPDCRDRSVPPDKSEVPGTPVPRARPETLAQPDLPDS